MTTCLKIEISSYSNIFQTPTHTTLKPCKLFFVKFRVLDVFPNLRNSVQIATLQMIGHTLLSTNFNTLQPHLQT